MPAPRLSLSCCSLLGSPGAPVLLEISGLRLGDFPCFGSVWLRVCGHKIKSIVAKTPAVLDGAQEDRRPEHASLCS